MIVDYEQVGASAAAMLPKLIADKSARGSVVLVDDPGCELQPLGLDATTRRRLTTDNARELLGLKSVVTAG